MLYLNIILIYLVFVIILMRKLPWQKKTKLAYFFIQQFNILPRYNIRKKTDSSCEDNWIFLLRYYLSYSKKHQNINSFKDKILEKRINITIINFSYFISSSMSTVLVIIHLWLDKLILVTKVLWCNIVNPEIKKEIWLCGLVIAIRKYSKSWYPILLFQ